MDSKNKISIKKPCSENFNNFQMTTVGGYCVSCQKEVIDFTKMTNLEIQNYFKVSKTKTCGYFLESQLNTNCNNEYSRNQNTNRFGISFIGASLLSLFATNVSFAQKKNDVIEINPTQKEEVNTKNKDSISDVKRSIISGIVLNEPGFPIPGVNIVLKGEKVNTSTDFDGKFTFPKLLEKGDILLISYIGYNTQEIKVTNAFLKIVIKESHTAMLGEVSVNQKYKSKTSFLDKLKKWF